MTPARRRRLEERRAELLAQLHGLPNLMRGSVYERARKCGRPSCTCARGGPRHVGVQLTVNMRGRTLTRYVPVGERGAIEAMLGAYRRLWELVEELTEVNLELVSAEGRRAAQRLRRAGEGRGRLG